MSRKTLLVTAPLGLGAIVLAWAAIAARTEPELKPARPAAKPAPARKAAPEEISATLEPPASAPFVSAPARAAAPAEGGENALILERIRRMEEKVVALEARRDAMLASNQDFERQIAVRNAEQSARTMAEWRVRQWEQMLGLTETQKQSLLDLCTKWNKDDAVQPPNRDAWLQREVDLRSMLSVEQSAKLHDTAAQQTEQLWRHLGRTIGGMVGASKDDQTRFQQTMGDYRAPNAMLLPEGYGADWPGLMREGAARLQPLLSADQMSKLGRFLQK
jgi:hypothetical protein